jgi:hypothetical protein
VAIGLAQFVRVSANPITGTNSTLGTLEDISIGFTLQILPCIPAALSVNGSNCEKHSSDSRDKSANWGEQKSYHDPSSCSLWLRKYQIAAAAATTIRQIAPVGLLIDAITPPPSWMMGMTS